MTADGGVFSYAFESVDRSFQYRVVAGGAASDAFAVTALSPPKVQSIDVSYTYPAFTGLSPREDKDGGDVYAPAGTRVRLQIHADKPLGGRRAPRWQAPSRSGWRRTTIRPPPSWCSQKTTRIACGWRIATASRRPATSSTSFA